MKHISRLWVAVLIASLLVVSFAATPRQKKRDPVFDPKFSLDETLQWLVVAIKKKSLFIVGTPGILRRTEVNFKQLRMNCYAVSESNITDVNNGSSRSILSATEFQVNLPDIDPETISVEAVPVRFRGIESKDKIAYYELKLKSVPGKQAFLYFGKRELRPDAKTFGQIAIYTKEAAEEIATALKHAIKLSQAVKS